MQGGIERRREGGTEEKNTKMKRGSKLKKAIY